MQKRRVERTVRSTPTATLNSLHPSALEFTDGDLHHHHHQCPYSGIMASSMCPMAKRAGKVSRWHGTPFRSLGVRSAASSPNRVDHASNSAMTAHGSYRTIKYSLKGKKKVPHTGNATKGRRRAFVLAVFPSSALTSLRPPIVFPRNWRLLQGRNNGCWRATGLYCISMHGFTLLFCNLRQLIPS